MPTAMVSSNKDDFFFLTKRNSGCRLSLISYMSKLPPVLSFPIVPCDFHPHRLQRALVPTCIFDIEDEREVRRAKVSGACLLYLYLSKNCWKFH